MLSELSGGEGEGRERVQKETLIQQANEEVWEGQVATLDLEKQEGSLKMRMRKIPRQMPALGEMGWRGDSRC